MKKILLKLSCLTMLYSCASVNSVSLTQIPTNKKNAIEAKVNKFVFLAFNFDNDYVDGLTKQLKDQCKGGQVKGILTKHETKGYFLFFDHIITAKGYCIKGGNKA